MKKIGIFLVVCILVFTIGCSKEAEPEKVSEAVATNTIVYITKTGECYHKSNCSTLKKSKIERNLSEVHNKYRPCSLCNPPVIELETQVNE